MKNCESECIPRVFPEKIKVIILEGILKDIKEGEATEQMIEYINKYYPEILEDNDHEFLHKNFE